MKVTTIKAYVYNTKCFDCNKTIPIYVTLADYGDPPVILKCKKCGELYMYTLDDVFYRSSLEKQLDGKTCMKCNAILLESLVPTHTHIRCCNNEFSLDDNFSDSINLDSGTIEDVMVSLIY